MELASRSVVHLRDGLRGHVASAEIESRSGTIEVVLDDGRTIQAPAKALVRLADGEYRLDVAIPSSSSGLAVGSAEGEMVIPVVVEEAIVSKKEVVTGTVRVARTVTSREETVDLPLFRDEVEVRRVPVGRTIDAAPAIRQEGDTTIIPVVEEVLVVETRLRLVEELHVTRRRTEHHEPKVVTLRSEKATVERVDDARPARPLPMS